MMLTFTLEDQRYINNANLASQYIGNLKKNKIKDGEQ